MLNIFGSIPPLSNNSGIEDFLGKNIEHVNKLSEVRKIKQYIGAYRAILGGLDAVVFTGTVGYRSKRIKSLITNDFEELANVKKIAIETDEELMIAKEIVKSFKIS